MSAAPSTIAAPVTVPAPNAILLTAEVAAWLRVHPREVQRLGVPPLKLGHRTVRYRASDVIAWIDRQATSKA